jgi:isoquinoline 1-oxidoreductase subunit beta
MKRRSILLSAVGIGGALIVGWGVMPQRSRLGAGALMLPTEGDVALNGWIKIALDGTVVLAMPRSEMGQGVHTALSMLVAEELDVPLSQVRTEQSGLDAIYGNVAMFVGSLPFHPQDSEAGQATAAVKTGEWIVGKVARELGVVVTGGSSSVADAWGPVRLAAATARAQLVGAAAAQWGVPVAQISITQGVLTAAGKTAKLGELAKAAAGVSPGEVKVKDAKDFKLLGTAAPRTDVPAKVNGTAQFGIDVRPSGMVFAAVRLCPMLGGSTGAFDAARALSLPAVERVVQLPALGGGTAGLAVIGATSWHAKQGAQAIEVQWQQRPLGALESAVIEKNIQAAAAQGGGFTFHSRGDTDAAEQGASRKLEAMYSAPYLAHATMEPMNCTAQVKDGKVTVWAPTQVPQMVRDIAAQVAGVPKDAVTVHVTLIGGGFGRRLDVDFVAQAVRVAMDCAGRPVQLLYSREEDTTHDFYRPAHAALLRASIDAKGAVTSLRIQSAGDAITPRWFERAFPLLAGPVDSPDKTTAEGLFDLPYNFSSQHMSHTATHSGVPVGYWRAVGHSHNAFFSEGFVTELAHATQTDPLEFRRSALAQSPRHLAVLNLAAEKAAWGKPLPAGRAHGTALHESFGSIVAQVLEVSLEQGVPRVHRVVCAIDCGTAVNPGVIAQQMESAVVFGLTAALYGRVDIVQGQVQQTNYPNYPMLKLAQAPVVQTFVVQSNAAPTGVGEPGLPPVAPALAAALFTLTGQWQRALPLAKSTAKST